MKLSDNIVKSLWIAFAVLIAVVLVQNAVIFFSLHSEALTGTPSAEARVEICITGQVPRWINPVECADATANELYACNLSEHLRPQRPHFLDVSMLSGNANGSTLFGQVNETTGMLEFNASRDQVGEYELLLTAMTYSSCPVENSTTFNLTILPDVGPPILLQPIPNSTWNQDSALIPYNIRNYWFDPMGSVEFLEYSVSGNQDVTIEFHQTGEVTLTPRSGWCGTELVRYTATSPFSNLSTESNLVELEVRCTPDSGEQEQTSTGGGGGVGGGGGTVSAPRACVEDIFCYEWSECQYTQAVTETGDDLELIIEGVRGSRVYLVEEMPENVSVFYRGYKYKECFDTRGCSDRTRMYTEACEFEPSCFDGIQNQDEEGVDCGGVCPPCQDEEVIDGVGDEEELIPEVRPEEPVLLDTEDRTTLFLFYTVLGLFVLVAALLILRRLIKALIAKLVFKHQKKNRVLLLEGNAKQRILDALQDIEARIGKEPVLKLQEELSGVVREYFQAILGLHFEFTYQELVEQLSKQEVLSLVQDILQAFFNRSIELEFSGKPVTETVLTALINEVREIVYQTAVLTQQDLKELEKDLSFRDIPDDVPQADRFYLLLSQAHIALQYGRVGVGQELYQLLKHVYESAPEQSQQLWYQDLQRFYLELSLSIKKENSLVLRRGNG